MKDRTLWSFHAQRKTNLSKRLFTILILICVPALCLSFLSCSKCKKVTYPALTFSEMDMKLIPYSGNETLVFVDSVFDSIVVFGSGRYDEMRHNYIYDDCNRYDHESELVDYAFQNTIEFQIELRQGFAGDTYETLKKYLYLSILLGNNYNIGSFSTVCFFENDSILPVYHVSFSKTLQIGDSIYKSVYVLVSGSNPPTKEDISLVYYSTNDGIIAFKTNKGRRWIQAKNKHL